MIQDVDDIKFGEGVLGDILAKLRSLKQILKEKQKKLAMN